MKKIIKLLRAFILIIRQPSRLNLILEEDSIYKQRVEELFPLLNPIPTIPISGFLGAEGETADPYGFLDGGSLPTDLALLKSLAKKESVSDYFEIGSWRGESLANVAPFVKTCVSLNLSDEEMRAMRVPDGYIEQHYKYSRRFSNIKELRGNSLNFDFSSLRQKFDLIFVDGDHHYEAVKNDTGKVFELLKNDDSVIVWHDAYRSPEKPRYEVLAGILEGCPDDARRHIYHVSNTLCAIYLKKNIKGEKIKFPVDQNYWFEVKVRMKEN